MDESKLIERSLSGDRDAFGQLVEKYQALVRARALALCGDLEQARDITQEVFVIAWTRLHEVKPGKLRAFLLAVTRNLVRNLRRKQREVPLDGEVKARQSSPRDRAAAGEGMALLQTALDEIPETLRVPVILYYQSQRSVAEVARMLEISPEAARQRISRGTRRLRADLAPHFEERLQASREPDARAYSLAICALLPAVSRSASGGVSLAGLGKTLAARPALTAVAGGLVVGATVLAVARGIEASRKDEPTERAPKIARVQQAAAPVPDERAPGATGGAGAVERVDMGRIDFGLADLEPGWHPPWHEQPLVTGELKLNLPETDRNGDGVIDAEEIAAHEAVQGRRMAESLLKARAMQKSLGDAEEFARFSATMRDSIEKALREGKLLKGDVITEDLRILVPGEDGVVPPFAGKIRYYGDDIGNMVGIARQASLRISGELVGTVKKGAKIRALSDVIKRTYQISSETLLVRCDQVIATHRGLTKFGVEISVDEIDDLLDGRPKITSEKEYLAAQLAEILRDGPPRAGICVGFSTFARQVGHHGAIGLRAVKGDYTRGATLVIEPMGGPVTRFDTGEASGRAI
jgi:RNA polymerase sigma factor (sigma-70 family)